MQKRRRRTRAIHHLRSINDTAINKFPDQDLDLICKNNLYHSPEVSSTEDNDDNDKPKILVQNLTWRSSTVSFINRKMINKFVLINDLIIRIFL